MTHFLLFIVTVLAGTINALAGGGGLITFPLLMLVVTPVTADATSAVALFFAYPAAVWRTRDQLAGVFGRGWLWLLLIPSVLGGLIGAVLLSRMGNRNFIQLVPWLVLVATVIIVLRPILVRRDESGSVHPDITVALWPVAIAGIFLVGLYGGYFGAGIGILMIGALSFISRGDIRHVVALKNFLNLCMRSGDLGARARRECELELRGANGDRWSCWGLRWGNDIASREPYSCSLHRYRDWFCRVSLLLLEVVRPGRGAGRRRIDGRAGLGDQRTGDRFSIPHMGQIIVTHKGTTARARIETSIRKGAITYEMVNCNCSGIHSRVRRRCVARSQRGENFNCNRSSHHNVADGKSVDWSWLG